MFATSGGARDPLNARLNYGYAVLRSMIARSLAMAGLNGSLGVGHCNQQNPFNLADDLIEPWRCVVEDRVLAEFEADPGADFDGQARKRLLQFILAEVPLRTGDFGLPAAIVKMVNDWVFALERHAQGAAQPPQLDVLEFRQWASLRVLSWLFS